MSCRSGCPTKDHATYAACLRASGVRVAYADSANRLDYSAQKEWDKVNQDYYDARRQGIDPKGCDRRSIDNAVRISNETGVAYHYDTPVIGM